MHVHTGIQRSRRMLWAGISAAVGKLSFCWNHETLKEATRMLLHVLPELRRSVKCQQKAVSQTSFSCLKVRTYQQIEDVHWPTAFYHLAGLHRDLTMLAECKYKSEPTVDKYASPDNIILLSAHLTMWKVPFQRQMREHCVSCMPYSEAEPRRSPDSSNIAVIFVGSQLWKQNLENAATVQYGASGVSWEYLRRTVNSFFTKPLTFY